MPFQLTVVLLGEGDLSRYRNNHTTANFCSEESVKLRRRRLETNGDQSNPSTLGCGERSRRRRIRGDARGNPGDRGWHGPTDRRQRQQRVFASWKPNCAIAASPAPLSSGRGLPLIFLTVSPALILDAWFLERALWPAGHTLRFPDSLREMIEAHELLALKLSVSGADSLLKNGRSECRGVRRCDPLPAADSQKPTSQLTCLTAPSGLPPDPFFLERCCRAG